MQEIIISIQSNNLHRFIIGCYTVFNSHHFIDNQPLQYVQEVARLENRVGVLSLSYDMVLEDFQVAFNTIAALFRAHGYNVDMR